MKLGFPNNPRRDIITEIEWIGRNGFEFVDLFVEPDRAAVDAIDPVRVKDALQAARLSAVGHLAWYLPIASPLPRIREAAVAAALEYIAALAKIGVSAATVHANWPPPMFSAKEGIAWQAESLRAILAAAGNLQVRIMYEPVDTELDTPENLEAILAELPHLRCHLDLGHCNLFGRDPVAMIRRFGSRLYHVHVHDNDGRRDLHLPPGTGSIDWTAVVQALRQVGYDRTITLEVFSRDRNYVLLAKQKIEELWRSTQPR
jgi:sugar phosphate isomerase/epimerase